MKTKQQPFLGFCFALITAIAWGTLPIALKQVLSVLNTQTIVWARFVVASAGLIILLSASGKLPKLSQLNVYSGRLVLCGICGLAGNFFLFNSSLNFIEPAVAQIFIHLSSFAMLICGVLFFKEKFARHQKIGLVILIIGLGLFFNDRAGIFFSLNQYSTGVFLSISAALVWVAYGVAQKLLLRNFTAQQVLLLIYLGCVIFFMPFADFKAIPQVLDNNVVLICFIYCCLNTIIGYGSYAEALNRWDISKVSVVITLVPLFTLLFSNVAHWFMPALFNVPELNSISYLGAFVVVLGAVLSAVGHKFLKKERW